MNLKTRLASGQLIPEVARAPAGDTTNGSLSSTISIESGEPERASSVRPFPLN
jgi:hypothetical protein